MEKPKILSDEQITEAIVCIPDVVGECVTRLDEERAIAQAQLDADVLFYEPLIQKLQKELETLRGQDEGENDAEQGAIEVLDELERIQQAKSEVVREIFEAIEKMWGWLTGEWSSEDKVMSIRYFHYQALKQETLSKYGGQKK